MTDRDGDDRGERGRDGTGRDGTDRDGTGHDAPGAGATDLVAHVDGDLVPASEAAVSVRDRGFLYGDAAFERVRAYGGTLWRWDAHVERLFGTLDALGMPAEETGLSALGLEARVRDTLGASGLEDASVRLSVTRGETPEFTPPRAADTDPTVVVLVKPLPRGGEARGSAERGERGVGGGHDVAGEHGVTDESSGSDASDDPGGPSDPGGTGGPDGPSDPSNPSGPSGTGGPSGPMWDGPATLQTVKTRRVPDRAVPSDAKTHSYLDSILARIETRVTGADEAVLLDGDGYVAGCATATLFFVADDAIRTPSLDGPVRPGVTRAEVLDIARGEDFPVEEGRYTPDDVRGADEAFVASSIREIRPVGTYDGVDIGGVAGREVSEARGTRYPGGPVTTLLARLYDRRVEEECYAVEADEGGDSSSN